MTHTRHGLIFRAAIFALAFAFALPVVALGAQGKGKGHSKGRGKPTEVFVNGHDARDGRWDKGGPKNKNKNRDRDWDDDDDWDDNDNRGRRRGRDRNGDGRIDDRGGVRDIAINNGYRAGFNEGRDDRADGNRYDYHDEGEYRDATSGYRNEYGDRDLYRRYFRQGYERGYRDGYENRSGGSRNGVGSVLGDIFGIPQ